MYCKTADKRSIYPIIFTDTSTNVRLHKYSCFKESFEYEKYLEVLNSKERNVLCRFRCSGHNLMIKKGRHLNIERSLRLCEFCNSNVIEDEYHFLLVCPFYRDLRRKYFKNYYFPWPNVHKFNLIMQTRSPTIVKFNRIDENRLYNGSNVYHIVINVSD